MDAFDLAFDRAARRGDDIRIKSIEAWCMHEEDCGYHWVITYSHPTGGSTSVSREINVPPKWITGIPREKGITAIEFPVTSWCPDLESLASRVCFLEEHHYSCANFVIALLWDHKRCKYIEDPDNQIRSLADRMTKLEEELSTFHVSEYLEPF
ncbi:hypothetical protein NUU61_005787 [Penicillium alfredii]|uniref:Uncharacterized protein n=1 Tax=Penicillium alfredii TaxID=1506179 RepID=A0A9W9FA99_9EURO|nr:uncharacterized protein NUU61_005787 [Penicillium alfredii]KAJ5096431.1 hypothetical protein NUU61_005787 [Penicillium alfredii]